MCELACAGQRAVRPRNLAVFSLFIIAYTVDKQYVQHLLQDSSAVLAVDGQLLKLRYLTNQLICSPIVELSQVSAEPKTWSELSSSVYGKVRASRLKTCLSAN